YEALPISNYPHSDALSVAVLRGFVLEARAATSAAFSTGAPLAGSLRVVNAVLRVAAAGLAPGCAFKRFARVVLWHL
ncbi:MAG: hypothetical protein ACREVZ_12040, partial [Burkholderiales bacterium]